MKRTTINVCCLTHERSGWSLISIETPCHFSMYFRTIQAEQHKMEFDPFLITAEELCPNFDAEIKSTLLCCHT